MKKFILAILAVAASIGGVTAQAKGPVASFEKTVHDYGQLEYAADGSYEFILTNTGDAPLIVTNVRSTCGCTVPEWPRQPIEPGATEKIAVRYDTRRTGPFTKSITVSTNTEIADTRLTIKGEVQANVKQD
jgi:hypothetical protein